MRYRSAVRLLSLVLTLFSVAPLLAATVTISPTSATVAVNTDRHFTATVTGAMDLSVQWLVNGIAGGNGTVGTVDATGSYRAPATPPAGNVVTVTAVSNADPSASASAQVFVSAPAPSIGSIAPNPIPLGAFNITVNGAKFVSGATVLYNGAPLATTFVSAAKLTATGSAMQAGSVSIKVANPPPGSTSASFTLNVVSTLVVTVSPSGATLQPGQTLQLSATVANSANQAVQWSASAGSVSANGLFTAPAAAPPAGYAVVTALSLADNVTTGQAIVGIQDPQAIQYGRFLDQATFGRSALSLAHVSQVGIPAFLDEQLAAPESPLPAVAGSSRNMAIDAFFANQLNGNDQLRQRVVYALSEIVVISMNKNVNGDMIVPWQQILSHNALGNYRTLLGQLTLDASMGMYLDMVNSAKPGISGGANENYAREVMQLFTIGLYQLNPDGSTKIDPVTNLPIPAYTQTDVQQMARALTGWTYNNASNAPVAMSQRGSYFPGPMVPVPSYHDTTAKTILGQAIPANQSPKQDVDAALDILFNHPNAGPFLATRLIRALVTSNPSPQYIQRIAATFDNNGSGVRGDLGAVIRAILLDAEARNDSPPPTFGRLRTPVQETIAMSRALALPLGAASNINYLFAGMGEDELNAPSVFGHYSPSFRVPKTALYGPEFQIYTASEAINRANFLYSLWFGNGGTLHPALAPFATIAGDPVALTTAVDNALLYGRMSGTTRSAIQQSLPLMYDTNQRVLSALYLTVTSGDFLVQH
ncbi:MAG: hypothetical protein JWO56_152 [Acidobacteria bacterium]|nr:hypothetical protein [Acidobacteriota bacterium]